MSTSPVHFRAGLIPPCHVLPDQARLLHDLDIHPVVLGQSPEPDRMPSVGPRGRRECQRDRKGLQHVSEENNINAGSLMLASETPGLSFKLTSALPHQVVWCRSRLSMVGTALLVAGVCMVHEEEEREAGPAG